MVSTTPERRAFLDRLYFLPKRLAGILAAIKSFRQSKIFLNRVSKKEAPNYYEVIKNPMDLSIVQKKIGKYRTFQEFKADLDLIWSNCLEFNEGKYYIDCATKMREVVSTLEIEMEAVAQDPEQPSTLETVEGGENAGPVVRSMVKRFVCEVLLCTGYSVVSGVALEVFSDVVQKRILETIAQECGEQ